LNSTVVHESPMVDARLASLGLTRERLANAILSGDAGASSSTALHPPGNVGYRRWADTVAGLRRQLLPHGWLQSNALNYCTVYNPATRVAIVVMAGDGNTGHRAAATRSKYPKGAVTVRRLRLNQQQASMFPDLKSPAEVAEEDCATWVLAQDADEDGVRAELSRPRSQDASGRVVDWYERILLPPVDPRGPSSANDEGGRGDDVDFAVTAR